MSGISACLIIKNEAKNLKNLLPTIQPFVQEIVVGDTGSTDQGAEIANQYGAIVFSIPWTQDFSAARNQTLKRATQDWILILDADEAIAPDDLRQLSHLIQDSTYDGFSFQTRNYTDSVTDGWIPCLGEYPPFEKAAGYFISTKVRLFKASSSIYFSGAIHETVESSILDRGGQIEAANIPIHHFGYLDSHNTIKKRAQYIEIGEKICHQSPSFSRHLELVKLYLIEGHLPKTRRHLEAASQINPKHSDIFFNWGLYYDQANQPHQAMINYQACLSLNPDYLAARLNLGIRLGQAGKPELGLPHLETICRRYPKHYLAQYHLGKTLYSLGAIEPAKQAFKTAFTVNPQHSPSQVAFHTVSGLGYAQNNKLTQALNSFQEAAILSPQDGRIHYNLGLTFEKLNRFDEARHSYQTALTLFPDHNQAKNRLASLRVRS